MHLPDGFLSPELWIPLDLTAAGALWLAARRAAPELEPEKVPLMGVMGAFVFAAQMINVPVASGTSGHLTGAVLLSVLLGPHLAATVMAAVLIVQCLLFQDGGLTALGANILHMGFVGAYGGYAATTLGRRLLPGAWGARVGVALGCWASVVLASLLVAVELALSGVVELRPALVAMGGVHAVIGVGEAALTLAVLSALHKLRPGLVPGWAGA
ncbi:MAG: energy-coupling factor ABC transporter permease [Pseudomonadota bacterium]